MGTRFMCTIEAPIHINIKKEIVKAQETDTALVLRRWKNTSRLYKNKVTEQAIKIEKESTTGKFEEVGPLVSGKRGREVFINGDPDYGVGRFPMSLSPNTDYHPNRSGLLAKLLASFTTFLLVQIWSAGLKRRLSKQFLMLHH